jgi:hypothetical protein
VHLGATVGGKDSQGGSVASVESATTGLRGFLPNKHRCCMYINKIDTRFKASDQGGREGVASLTNINKDVYPEQAIL